MPFIKIFACIFIAGALAGCATNPSLNGMRYDVDRYRAHDMIKSGGGVSALSLYTGMRRNVDEYRAEGMIADKEHPSLYEMLVGMRRNVNEFRGDKLGASSEVPASIQEETPVDEDSDTPAGLDEFFQRQQEKSEMDGDLQQ